MQENMMLEKEQRILHPDLQAIKSELSSILGIA